MNSNKFSGCEGVAKASPNTNRLFQDHAKTADDAVRGFLNSGLMLSGKTYHAKCAKALLASAMRWVFSRVEIALPSL